MQVQLTSFSREASEEEVRQWRCSTINGGKRNFRPPLPDDKLLPDIVKVYEASTWRRDDMSLIEFLRRTNAEGQAPQ